MINQRNNNRYIGTLILTIISFSVLLLSGCSPLHLVNTVSTESNAITVSHQSYGNDKRQQLDVYMPASVASGSPVIVFFYGGSWKNGEKENYAFVGQSMGSKGYVTVIPDYRLYPEVTFPAFVEDGAKVLAWVSENVDQARHGVVVMGHSAGAHTAALLALDQSYLEATGQPASLISGMVGLAGPYGFNPMDYRSTRPIFAHVDTIEKTMPVTFACSARVPLLLIHGADDGVVYPDNSRELNRRAYACAGNVTYVELDDIGHYSILLGLSDSFLAKDAIQSPIDVFLQTLTYPPG
jgi:acetyl esterase/lipase